MCGISGYITTEIKDTTQIQLMCDVISHRGPDDQGYWIDDHKRITLGHRRLSIIDLSPEGHQPMTSTTGQFVIVFNGEIYNFKDLKQQVIQDGFIGKWRGHSDTEVLLACFETWGVESTLKKTNGMFAIALYDTISGTLHLARDRMGEKPLYYGQIGDTFYFCSELKSIKKVCTPPLKISHESLTLYMRHGYVPGPFSIYEDIYKLEPAHSISISIDESKCVPMPPRPYWSLKDVVEKAVPITGTDNEIMTHLEDHLNRSIQMMMISDVPLGAFLSGGYDSSLVVALMQNCSKTRVKTFSIGFESKEYNEAADAKRVADYLGTDHTELYITAEKAMEVIPKLPTLYCEPFSDSSQIPTFLVSELAKLQVTVALSGDAGDELFAGYNRYFWGVKIWNLFSRYPLWMRRFFKYLIYLLPPDTWNLIITRLTPLIPKQYRVRFPGHKMYKLANLAQTHSIEDLYCQLVSSIKNPSDWLVKKIDITSPFVEQMNQLKITDPIHKMMFSDMISYLPGDILTKVDRASMGVSLETRVPFLDHHLVEFSWRLPMKSKIRDGNGKWILKQLTHKYIPKKIMDRPKMGFGVPIDQWLRGPLKEWAELLLDPVKLKDQGFFDSDYVQARWKEHLSGERDLSHQLWTVLMFQAWINTQTQ